MNRRIFTDDDYMSSSVTNRPDPSINFQNNYISVKENNLSTMEEDLSASKHISCITPEQVNSKKQNLVHLKEEAEN